MNEITNTDLEQQILYAEDEHNFNADAIREFINDLLHRADEDWHEANYANDQEDAVYRIVGLNAMKAMLPRQNRSTTSIWWLDTDATVAAESAASSCSMRRAR